MCGFAFPGRPRCACSDARRLAGGCALRFRLQSAYGQTVRRHPAAVEVRWWRWFCVQDAGVDAAGGGDPAALLAGQSSAAVPVGLPSPGRGAAQGRGGPGSSLSGGSPISLRLPSFLF